MEIKDQAAYEAGQRFARFLAEGFAKPLNKILEDLVLFSPEPSPEPKSTVEGSAIVIDEQQKALPAPQEEKEQ